MRGAINAPRGGTRQGSDGGAAPLGSGSCIADTPGYEVAWEANIDNYDGTPLMHRWKQRVDSVQSFEELRRDLEVLSVELESYDAIVKMCRSAVCKAVTVRTPVKDLRKAKALLVKHFTKKRHQLLPLTDRMTRGNAEEYCIGRGLLVFAGDLEDMRFIDDPCD